jgi:hypothetical protein
MEIKVRGWSHNLLFIAGATFFHVDEFCQLDTVVPK